MLLNTGNSKPTPKDYLRCVAGIDRAVGSVLDYLEESGLSENTIVVYTSDQGFTLESMGGLIKDGCMKNLSKCLFLIKHLKNIEAGTTSDAMVMNVDFAPTLIDMAGLEIPSEMQEKVLKVCLKKKKTKENLCTITIMSGLFGTRFRHYGIKTKRYKLMHFYYSMDEWEL